LNLAEPIVTALPAAVSGETALGDLVVVAPPAAEEPTGLAAAVEDSVEVSAVWGRLV